MERFLEGDFLFPDIVADRGRKRVVLFGAQRDGAVFLDDFAIEVADNDFFCPFAVSALGDAVSTEESLAAYEHAQVSVQHIATIANALVRCPSPVIVERLIGHDCQASYFLAYIVFDIVLHITVSLNSIGRTVPSYSV